jgi:single-strand DNA-binding protein
MSSVNKVILIGNAGRDAEVRYLPSGAAVANVSIATSSKRKDKQSGEVIEDTQWHRLTFYERLAEIAGEYITKGKTIYVEGRLKYGKYTDKDGVEKPTCDIVVEQLQLLGGREQGDGGQQQAAPRQQQAPRQQGNGGYNNAPRQQQNAAPRQQPQAQSRGGFEDMDDDIPF